jgi:hypothetical protein
MNPISHDKPRFLIPPALENIFLAQGRENKKAETGTGTYPSGRSGVWTLSGCPRVVSARYSEPSSKTKSRRLRIKSPIDRFLNTNIKKLMPKPKK